MGTSATAPVTAPEDVLRRARGAVARAGPDARLIPQELPGPVAPSGGVEASGPDREEGRAGAVDLLGTTCTAVPRDR